MGRKVNIMVDVKVEIESPTIPYYARHDLIKTEKYLKEWASDFHDFIRDHRSQDPVKIDVVRVMKDVCSDCKEEWEIYEEAGKIFCANCGAEVETEIKEPTQ